MDLFVFNVPTKWYKNYVDATYSFFLRYRRSDRRHYCACMAADRGILALVERILCTVYTVVDSAHVWKVAKHLVRILLRLE